MHDSAMMQGLIRTAESAARDAGATAVAAIRIRIGALSGISPDHLQEHFDEAVAGTSLEGSELIVEHGPDGVDALDDPAAMGVLLTGLDVEDS